MALETFIVIAAMTCDTWERDASVVYEIEMEKGHPRWRGELILLRVKKRRGPSAELSFYRRENTTNDSFKQKASKIVKHFDLFCGALLFQNNGSK